MRHVLDSAASRFTVQGFATGLLSALGHNPVIAIRDFEGEIQFVPGTYDKAFLHVKVSVATFEVLDEIKRDDREKLNRIMFQDVLTISRFPSVSYESKQIEARKTGESLLQVTVMGDLTLRDVTRPHSFTARVQDMGNALRISGEFLLRQSDYGIKPVSFAGGALRLKDELRFRFEIVTRLEE